MGEEITLILQRLGAGDPTAADELMPLVYGELRQLSGLPAIARNARRVVLASLFEPMADEPETAFISPSFTINRAKTGSSGQ